METDRIELKELSSNGSLPDYQTAVVEGEDPHRVSAPTAGKMRIAAVVVSWCSVVFSFSTGVAAIVLGHIDKSEALFGYGLDATLDGLSSIAVLWRFYGSASDLYSEKKERRACLVIGMLFILSGLLLTGKSTHSIMTKNLETKSIEEIILYTSFALTTGVVSVVLAFIKVYLGYKLESEAMATDSIITFVGAAMSFAGVAGLELYVQNTHLWFMDSVFGIICGVFLIIFGIKVLCGVLRTNKSEEHLPLQGRVCEDSNAASQDSDR